MATHRYRKGVLTKIDDPSKPKDEAKDTKDKPKKAEKEKPHGKDSPPS